ncbi:MEKHLA domain-containing protein [Rhodoplanes elegans]|uniref:MEKHLA domain-containing protein n=1 Tax=Rhodoplanes elegans TaxID=29408 RepID=A0A327KR21_9BRAD|nr:MEKHLA domain-containing protein [Rhodoplanes elegans]MBK5961654.1 MEKHLA domain-containing protein [Rhodoplanes elegans]RAI40073.1 MEKHLA domain-containing protein [Rhodoplanes elegans]
MSEPAVDLRTDPHYFALLTSSFSRLVGRPLVPAEADATWLYVDAPFVCVAHDTQADPRFVYANRAAQTRFGYGWDEFVGLPSRLSAQAPERAERQQFLDTVAAQGYVAGYRGLRVKKSGATFWIEDGLVWQLRDDTGTLRGTAAVFSTWTDVG